MKTLTRRELYELAWSKPMTDIAQEFGLSDVGLAKICKRHRVPTPPRGYWAKVKAGKKVKQTLFVEITDRRLDLIQIHGGYFDLPEPVVNVLKKAKEARKTVLPAPVMTERKTEPSQDIHRIISRTAQALRKKKPDVNNAIYATGEGLCGVSIGSASVERAIHLLNILAHQLEAKEFALAPAENGIKVTVNQDSVTFSLTERTRREKHIPTPEDLAAEERRQKKLSQYWRSPHSINLPHSSFERAYPEYDIIQTGQLVLQVDGYDRGLRRSWADGKTQTLETLIDSFVVGVEALLISRKDQREKNEIRERQWQELSRRRDLARKRAEREAQRVEFLDTLMAYSREIMQLHRWIDDMKASGPFEGDFSRFFAWSEARLVELEEKVGRSNLAHDLNAKGLFPEIDSLFDPLGDPPETRW